ncbi:MAG: histidinol-phosphate transaminase [Deltaproteobacteria bacterium]|nr:histidinol-phosphate transaminase [Deltaproteobacteria bacterium]
MKTPAYIDVLSAYEPGKPISVLQRETGVADIVKLASNENPLGPSPKAMAAMQRALPALHRYPDDGFALKQALAAHYGVPPDEIVLGSGSDSLMLAIVRAFVSEGGEVVTSQWSFAQYYLMPQSRGAVVRAAPMHDYRYDLAAVAALVTDRTQLIFLANPNNPTGTMYTRAEWAAFYARIPPQIPIVCDEAYAEFVQGDPEWPDSLRERHDNVITLRTFSKAYGLAGLRLGFAIATPAVAHTLHKVKLPFEPSGLALVAGTAALEDQAFVREYVTLVREERAWVTAQLQRLGIAVVPSVANFVLVHFPTVADAARIHGALEARGIIVRPLAAAGLPQALRITIGRPDENRRLMAALEVS